MHPRQAALLEASRRMWASDEVAMEHSSPEEMQQYLKDHPHADKSKHTVKKKEKEESSLEKVEHAFGFGLEEPSRADKDQENEEDANEAEFKRLHPPKKEKPKNLWEKTQDWFGFGDFDHGDAAPAHTASRRRALNEVAMEFTSPEALQSYLKDHPGADPSKHTVTKDSGPHLREEDKYMDQETTDGDDYNPNMPEHAMGLYASRQAALRVRVARFIQAVTFPREFHLPEKVRNTEPENPEGTDLYVWKYNSGPSGTDPYAIAFVGKQSKPLWHHRFRTEQARDQLIQRTTEQRRTAMEAKLKKKLEKKNFQHSFVVDDILYSSWGYDQTNINFYQVIEVRGKEIIIREIGGRVVSGRGSPSEKVMAEPGEFIGPPMRKRPQGSGENVYVKIDNSQTAFEWDGSPEYQTGSGYGH